MKYNGLTSVGSIYQAKCAANNIPVKFVKVKVGNGLLEETENPLNFTDIKSLKKEVGISEITQVNEAVRLTVPLDNDGVTEGYYPREFGIYVEDDGVEVLYWYINDGQEASYLPPQSSAPVKIKNHFNIIATSLESLIVNWDGKEFWVDKEYLGKELAKKEDKIEIKESAFNRPFGTSENEVLEGIQLARTLGLEYGGELNNSNTKKLNTIYYDTQNKSFFKCFRENTLNYADSNYYEGISNNDLLLKLQNLLYFSTWTSNGSGWRVTAIRTYKTVTINIDISGVKLDDVLNAIILPEIYRPVNVKKYSFPLTAWLGNNAYGTISINENGTIISSQSNIQEVTFNITGTYLI